MLTGSCLCKSVSYKIANTPSNCNYCLCSVCRRLTGSAMAAYGAVQRSDFAWANGEGLLHTYQQNELSNRVFCSKCGSCVVSHHDLAPDFYFVSLGCLDSHNEIDIEYQQFVASKAEWVNLDPTIEQCEAYPEWVFERYSKKSDSSI